MRSVGVRPRWALLVGLVVGLSIVACGGSDEGAIPEEAPTATPEPSPPVESEADGLAARGITPSAEATAILGLLDSEVAVRLDADDEFDAAVDRQPLDLGHAVRTDETGFAEVVYPDGSLTRLASETTFTVVALAAADPGIEVEADLSVGRVWNRVQDLTSSGGRFQVTTSVATATARGTTFTVGCTASEGPCTFTVFEGEVVVRTTAGDEVVLGPGQRVTVEAGGAPGEVQDVGLPAVEQDAWVARNRELDDERRAVLAEGRLDGQWEFQRVVIDADGAFRNSIGDRFDTTWTFVPDCPQGACGGTVTSLRAETGTGLTGTFEPVEAGWELTGVIEHPTQDDCAQFATLYGTSELTATLTPLAVTAGDPGSQLQLLQMHSTEVWTPDPDAVEADCTGRESGRTVTVGAGRPVGPADQ